MKKPENAEGGKIHRSEESSSKRVRKERLLLLEGNSYVLSLKTVGKKGGPLLQGSLGGGFAFLTGGELHGVQSVLPGRRGRGDYSGKSEMLSKEGFL